MNFVRLLFLVVCFSSFVYADGITIKVVSTSIQLPPGFVAAPSEGNNPMWTYYHNPSNGAGIRLMEKAGELKEDQYGWCGFFWGALMNDSRFDGQLVVSNIFTICSDGECKDIFTTASLSYDPSGLRVIAPPLPQYFVLNGKTIWLSFYVNPLRYTIATTDMAIQARYSHEVPEPITLMTLGAGLFALGRSLRKRR